MDINVNVTIGMSQQLTDALTLVTQLLKFTPLAKPVEVDASPEQQEGTTAATAVEPKEVAEATPVIEDVIVNIGDVRDKVSELIRTGKKQQIVELLNNYGVTGYSQLSGKDLAEFYNTIKTL